MFLTFGGYKFEGLRLPQTWTQSRETVYGQVDIIGGKPSLQKVGEKLEEIEIGIFLSSDWCNTETELAALDKLRINGVVSNLVTGSGNNLGKYVITSVDEDVISAIPEGYKTGISATIKLLEYNTSKTIIQKNGKAYSNNKPIEQDPLTPIPTPVQLILTSQTKAIDLSNQISIACSGGQMTVGKLGTLKETAQQAISLYNDETNKINAISKLFQRNATVVKSKIDDCSYYCTQVSILADRLKTATKQVNDLPGSILGQDSLKDYVDLSNNGNLLSGAIYALNVASAPFAGIHGNRESL
jgi:phage protein U